MRWQCALFYFSYNAAASLRAHDTLSPRSTDTNEGANGTNEGATSKAEWEESFRSLYCR
jgi:hypothetical protein